MHDGSVATLEDVIEYYDRGGNRNPNLDPEIHPLRLSAEEERNLANFFAVVRPLGTIGGVHPAFREGFLRNTIVWSRSSDEKR